MSPHPQPRIIFVLRRAHLLLVSSSPADPIRLLFRLYQPPNSGSYLYDLAPQLPRTRRNSFLTRHHFLLHHIQNP